MRELAQAAAADDRGDELVRLEAELAEVRARYAEALRHNEILSEAGKLLASSLDPEETLRQVAHLVVPSLGDWCAVDLLDPDGTVELVAAAHTDPEREAFARELRRRHPSNLSQDEGLTHVLRTGEPLLVPEMSDEMLGRSKMPPDFVAGIRQLGLRSVMIVPMAGRSGLLGALTLVIAESGRRYGPADLTLAEKLASRAAMALENARLVHSLRTAAENEKRLLIEQAARAAAEAAREQLQQSRAALAEAQAIAGLGSWTWDMRANAVTWSEELYRIYGRDPATFTPSRETFLDALVPEDRDEAARFLQEAMERGGASAADYRIVRPDGSIRTLQCRREVHHEDGVAVRMVGTCLDVTERKQVEQVLQHNAEELARSNAELERFAYVASHDLQEPLRMVASYVQLLARRYHDKLDGDARDFIGYAVEGVTRMQRLIEDLLAYSRVETRTRRFVPVDANAVAGRALRNLQIALEETGASVEVEPLPTVRADEVQLLQLFQNLIGNGIKFRRDERPVIRVSAVSEGDFFRFTVRDNGIGIEPVYFDKIFLLFQRLHGREEYPGTGIGLAICKKIVERHAGRIWVESEPGRGSAFHFTLQGEAK